MSRAVLQDSSLPKATVSRSILGELSVDDFFSNSRVCCVMYSRNETGSEPMGFRVGFASKMSHRRRGRCEQPPRTRASCWSPG